MINIKSDSRKIVKGDIFVAIKEVLGDGHDYIDKAINNGASSLVVERDGNYSIPYKIVPDTREYLTNYLIDNYSYVNDMIIIGVTGTNGKTTIGYLVNKALNRVGIKTAYIGTLGYYIDEKIEDLSNTSPDICEMYRLLDDAHSKECKVVIIEASSQGLVRGRLKGIKFDYAIFTNLTQDHLDEHKTMENYANAKRILFDNLKENGISILNFDDNSSSRYKTQNNIYYGFSGGDYRVLNYNCKNTGTNFKYAHDNVEMEINTKLLGNYNISNTLVVIIIMELLKVDITTIKETLKELPNPDGRLDIVKYKNNAIIIDYAHTPDAMMKVLNVAKLVTKGNIYTVFGCTGDRDRLKRPIMMKIAEESSNHVIITIDDLHFEDPNQIVDDMLKNNMYSNYEVILDRGDAIKKAISLLNSEDTLLILGKGHENGIVIGKTKIPFNDKEFVLETIANL